MEYNLPVPTIGDSRYNKMYHKPNLDLLRIEYYNRFGKDLSLTYINNDDSMFDANIWETGYQYMLRGIFSSIIILDAGVKFLQKNSFLNWKIEEKYIDHPQFKLYYEYMNESLKLMNGIYFNFIYKYGNFKDIYFSYLPSGINKSRFFELDDFMERLMDNNHVDVIWMNNELLEDSKNKQDVLNRINNEYECINRRIFLRTGLSYEEYNSELRQKLKK